MSIRCDACRTIIRKPDTAWYAATKYSYRINYVCGTCVSLIPSQRRKPVAGLQIDTVTFGRLMADVGLSGRYQWFGAKQGPPLFCTDATYIRERYAYAEHFLAELHPHYCLKEHVDQIMAAYRRNRKTDETSVPDELFREVKAYGPAIASLIGMKVAINTNPVIDDMVSDADALAIVEKLQAVYR